MRTVRCLIRNRKGIDTILAALLMVVIVVVASVMVYAWSTGLLGSLLVTPSAGKEAMNIENSAFTNSTLATLYLRNTGSASITLVTYYVTDSANNQYSKTSGWGQSAIAPGGLATPTINIGAQCGCTAAANGFTFQSGSAYTVIVVTSRNNQFSFTVTR